MRPPANKLKKVTLSLSTQSHPKPQPQTYRAQSQLAPQDVENFYPLESASNDDNIIMKPLANKLKKIRETLNLSMPAYKAYRVSI